MYAAPFRLKTIKSIGDYLGMPYRASAALPSTGLPDPIRARTIHGALATSPARYSLIIGRVCLSSKNTKL
jgi:hypothetical protein